MISQLVSDALSGDARAILALACLYTALACGWSAWHVWRVRRWPSVEGQLDRFGLRLFGIADRVVSEREYVSDALYRYRVGAKQYEGRRVSAWMVVASHNAQALLRLQLRSVRPNADGQVRIYHHPRKPQRSLLLRPSQCGLAILCILSLGSLGLSLYLVNVLAL